MNGRITLLLRAAFRWQPAVLHQSQSLPRNTSLEMIEDPLTNNTPCQTSWKTTCQSSWPRVTASEQQQQTLHCAQPPLCKTRTLQYTHLGAQINKVSSLILMRCVSHQISSCYACSTDTCMQCPGCIQGFIHRHRNDLHSLDGSFAFCGFRNSRFKCCCSMFCQLQVHAGGAIHRG